jgi:hypothetical protein
VPVTYLASVVCHEDGNRTPLADAGMCRIPPVLPRDASCCSLVTHAVITPRYAATRYANARNRGPDKPPNQPSAIPSIR